MITFQFQASQTAAVGSGISFALGLTTDTTPIDWSSVEDAFRPSAISPPRPGAAFGATSSPRSARRKAPWKPHSTVEATYLSQLGEYQSDVNSLIGFELEKANDYLPVSAPASPVDAASPVPGLPLMFSRESPADDFRLAIR